MESNRQNKNKNESYDTVILNQNKCIYNCVISNRKVHGMTNTYYSSTKMYPLEYFDTMPKWKLTDIAKVLRIKGSRKLKKRQLVDTIFRHHETQNVQLSCSLETKEQILRCKHIVSHIKSFLFYKDQSEFDLQW